MFVRDFQIVQRPFTVVDGAIRSDPSELLSEALHAARVEGERLRGGVAPAGWPSPLAVTVDLVTGPLRSHGDALLLTFAWDANQSRSLFPHFDADLELAPFGRERSQISLSGNYVPPGGAIGKGIDRLVLHRVAESTIRAFLVQLLHALEARGEESPGRQIA